MGFSVSSPSNISSLMTEIALGAAAEGTQEPEGLTLPTELMDPETLKELLQQGSLRGESKSFLFVPDKTSSLPQKLTDYIADMNRPQTQKFGETKGKENHPLSFKENLIREKEFKVLESHKHQETQLREKGLEPQKQPAQKGEYTFSKTQSATQRTFEKAALPKALQSPLKEAAAKQQTHSKVLEHQLRNSMMQQERPQESKRKHTEEQRQTRQEKAHDPALSEMHRAEKNKNDEREQEQRKQKDEEEGFADGQKRNQDSDDSAEQGKEQKKINKIDNKFIQAFGDYASQDSILSEIFKMRVTQFDVLVLFIEILKLDIRGREQERLARRQERELQILHMQKVVENYKSQGNWMMFSSIGSGVLAIVSGVAPIVGHIKGAWILEKLSSISFLSKLREMKPDQFFKGVTKITFAMSEMYKSTGQIHQSFSEGNRTFDQHMSDLHRTDWEENTRAMEEIKDSWKGIENFLYQALQMYHETIRQLYSH